MRPDDGARDGGAFSQSAVLAEDRVGAAARAGFHHAAGVDEQRTFQEGTVFHLGLR